MTIVLDHLSVSYGPTEVLHEISLTIESGSWLAPIGPNGAGKSTMLRAIAGLVTSTGAITFNGEPLGQLSRRALAREVAFVPQRPVLPAMMSVADYVLLGRTPHIAFFANESRGDRDIAWSVLERLGLTQFANRRLDEISGGEAQRAVLARALAQQASVLLLDEPTASLDLGRQQQVLELVDDLRKERGLTVVSAMHDLTLASQFATTLVLMDNGHIVAAGTPEEVLDEEVIDVHYGANVRVTSEGDGTVVVVPRRRRD